MLLLSCLVLASLCSQHFATEMRENKTVRLIYNGQALEDQRTLQSYNIDNNTVIHVLITEQTTPQTPSSSHSHEVVFNAGSMMVPLFTIILLLIWYLRLEFGQFFTATSTISLVCITVTFGICVLIQRLHQHAPRAHREREFNIFTHTNVRANLPVNHNQPGTTT